MRNPKNFAMRLIIPKLCKCSEVSVYHKRGKSAIHTDSIHNQSRPSAGRNRW